MTLRIAGYVPESAVDGPGYRLAVFVQGCPHACPGCHNPHTHNPLGGRVTDTDELLPHLQSPLLRGLTLTGGEPLAQPEGCLALARAARGLQKDVWLYSGWTFEALLAQGGQARLALLDACDVLVDGPFLLEQRTLELPFRGSRNQRLIDLPASLRLGRAVLHSGT